MLAACADNLNGPNGCIFAYDITPKTITLQVADSTAVQASAIRGCGGGSSVSWTVDDNSKATVRSTGNLTAIVRGVAKGSTVLNVTDGIRTGFALVDVK